MRGAFLAAAVFLMSLVLQVETTATPSRYYHERTCPFPTDMAGDLTMEELPKIVGIPITDKNFKDYLWQQLCKAMCYKPVTPLDDIADMVHANAQFKCQNDQLRIVGDNPNEILTSWNSQVQKPECEVVHNTIVCVVDAFQKSVYVNIFLQNCAITYHFYVVDARETFGGLQCNLNKLTIVDNFFEFDLTSNANTNQEKKIFLAPKAEGRKIVAYEKLNHAMLATQNYDQYKQMLGTWQELCGEDTGHNTSSMCKSVTRNMTKVCKRLCTNEDNKEILRIETCLKEKYLGLAKKTQAEIDLCWCGLKKWEMEPNMKECLNLISNPETQNEGGDSFAFIRSFGNSIYHMGDGVYQFLCTVCKAVSWVWNWFVWGFWNIGLYTAPSLYVADRLQGVTYIGGVAAFLFSIITTSMQCADGFEGCKNKRDHVCRSIKLAVYGLPYLVISFLLSVLNCMFKCIGLSQSFITELKKSCSIMRTECVQLTQGLQHVENLEGRVNLIDQRHTELEALFQKKTHQQTAAGMRRRRERSLDDANRQGMHVSPSTIQPLESKIDELKANWGRYKQNTTPGEVDDLRSGMIRGAARGRSHQNGHRQWMNASTLDESLNPF